MSILLTIKKKLFASFLPYKKCLEWVFKALFLATIGSLTPSNHRYVGFFTKDFKYWP